MSSVGFPLEDLKQMKNVAFVAAFHLLVSYVLKLEFFFNNLFLKSTA